MVLKDFLKIIRIYTKNHDIKRLYYKQLKDNKHIKERTTTMIILNHKLSIFMMEKDNDGNDLSKINNQAKKQLTIVFGGLTITPAEGFWIDGNQLYVDNSYIFTCNYSGKLTETQISAVIEIIKDELNKGKQQAVSIMLDDTLCILNGNDLDELKNMLIKN